MHIAALCIYAVVCENYIYVRMSVRWCRNRIYVRVCGDDDGVKLLDWKRNLWTYNVNVFVKRIMLLQLSPATSVNSDNVAQLRAQLVCANSYIEGNPSGTPPHIVVWVHFDLKEEELTHTHIQFVLARTIIVPGDACYACDGIAGARKGVLRILDTRITAQPQPYWPPYI